MATWRSSIQRSTARYLVWSLTCLGGAMPGATTAAPSASGAERPTNSLSCLQH